MGQGLFGGCIGAEIGSDVHPREFMGKMRMILEVL
jgi:hypothetical protein